MPETHDQSVNNPDTLTEYDDHTNYQELESEWLNICKLGVASANAAMASWIHFTCAAFSLHTSSVYSNAATRASARRAIIENITHSETKCKDMLRLSTEGFAVLLQTIKNNTKVKNYCRGSLEEQLITFLFILGHNLKNRVVSFLLCRSGETISRYFHNILLSVITLEDIYVKPANRDEVQPTIVNSHRFFPFFKDCLGAVDGTHVRVKASQVDAPRYRGRKDWPTQNVLGACTFDLKFTYILAGWEGSAADSRVLHSALTRDEPLLIPEGKYYLGDAGFGLSPKILTSYGRTRYHLKEYSHHAPKTPEEFFNHRHSSLRNAIERAFGVLKKRLPIIASGSECQYNIDTMTNIILACTVLHNFLRTVETEYGFEANEDILHAVNGVDDTQVAGQSHREIQSGMDYIKGRELRDRIASEMWSSYVGSRG